MALRASSAWQMISGSVVDTVIARHSQKVMAHRMKKLRKIADIKARYNVSASAQRKQARVWCFDILATSARLNILPWHGVHGVTLINNSGLVEGREESIYWRSPTFDVIEIYIEQPWLDSSPSPKRCSSRDISKLLRDIRSVSWGKISFANHVSVIIRMISVYVGKDNCKIAPKLQAILPECRRFALHAPAC